MMGKVIVVILFLFLVRNIYFSEGDMEIQTKYTNKGAKLKCCQKRSSSTVVKVIDAATYQQVVQGMEERGLNETWLALQKITHNGFVWISGEIPRDDYIKEKWEKGLDCMLYHFSDKAFQAEPCTKEHGHLCSRKNCSSCTNLLNMIDHHTCIIVNATCFVLRCGASNWYKAQIDCEHLGMELSTFHELDGLRLMRSEGEVRKRLGHTGNKCVTVWIGISRAQWVIPYSETNDKIRPKDIFWRKGEPSADYNCSVMQQGPDGYLWNAVNCESEHPVLCSSDLSRQKSIPVTRTESSRATESISGTPRRSQDKNTENAEYMKSDQRPFNIYLTVIGSISLCLLILICCILIRAYKMNQIKRSNVTKGEEIPLQEDRA